MRTPLPPLADLCAYARLHADADGLVHTGVPGLRMMCVARPGPKLRSTYRPLVCMVLQGAKHLLVGRQEVVCHAGQSVVVGADMPVSGQVIEASVGAPYLAIAVEFNMATLSEQAERMQAIWPVDGAGELGHAGVRTLFMQPTKDAVLDCGRRLLQLIEAREAVPFLLSGLQAELQYHLLTGPDGLALRELVSRRGTASRLTPAVAMLHDRFREPL